MLRIRKEVLKPGMRLAKPIFTEEDQLLLHKGEVLKGPFIDRIKNYEVKEVYIDWHHKYSMEIMEGIIQDTQNQIQEQFKKSFHRLADNKNPEFEKIEKLVEEILNEILDNKKLLIDLTEVRSTDNYTFEHSVNVCILAMILGKALGYSKKNLKKIGLGALLHDIGKVGVDEEILKKSKGLTDLEYEEIKRHTTKGYELVKSLDLLCEDSRRIIRDHHEWVNGKGYPKGLKDQAIHPFARIVAICDQFDALSTDRVYRKAWPFSDVVEYLIAYQGEIFDGNFVQAFLQSFETYLEGRLIELSSGKSAVVRKFNRSFPTRPMIQIIQKEARGFMELEILDLTKKHNEKIVKVYH